MFIKNKKKFTFGLFMTIGFFIILGIMFSPLFGGTNAFHAADGLFNSISKASASHFEQVHSSLAGFERKSADQELQLSEAVGQNVATIINAAGQEATYVDGTLTVRGEINPLLDRMLSDSEAMFANNGEVLENAYGIAPKAAMYAWWMYANTASKKFMLSKRFDTSKIIDEVKTKAVEVSYNYYGVDPTPATERIAILTFALVFYVIYTIWWGFAIFELFAGLGLTMTKASKKEAQTTRKVRALNMMRRFFDPLLHWMHARKQHPEPLGEEELEALRRRFRARHHNFKLLLSGNNEALEHIGHIEELARGVHPFGGQTVRASAARITTLAYRSIKHLEAITSTPQTTLLERFSGIKDNVDEVLSPHRRVRDVAGGSRILPLSDVTKQDADHVGPKMARLGEAKNVLGMNVPDGFVITAAAFQEFMNYSELRDEINRRIQARSDELTSRMPLAQELQALVLNAPLPPALEDALVQASAALAQKTGAPLRLVVRSSALGEDLAGASFAGQHRSAVNVSRESLSMVYKEIVASTYSLEAISYRLTKGIPEESAVMCVGVLQMVDATAGGVAYSRDPMGVRADSALVYSVFGLPKQMVDGVDAADFIALDRESAEILEHDIGHKTMRTVCNSGEGVRHEELDPVLARQSSIDAPTARRLFDLAMRLERHFGEPQDMEWALNPEGEIVVLQTRPLPAAIHRGVTSHELDLPLPGSPVESEEVSGETAHELGRGIVASPGVAAGPVHILQREADMLTMAPGSVIVVKRPLPRFAPALADASAIVAEEGGAAGHLASVARELGKPALFGVVDALRRLPAGEIVTVDADSMVLFAGRQEVRLQRRPPQTNLMRGSRVHDMLLAVLPHIARLTLLDPQSDEFAARNCQSMHDIFRFCHERALLAMFDFGEDTPFPDRAARLLAGGKSSQFKVIDLGDAFHHKTHDNKIRVEDVESVPFQAFWKGMTAVPWAGPPAVETKGLASILHEAMLNTDLEPSMPSAYTAQNYFMVAQDFMSAQSRFGFHFSTVEALVSERPRENYVSFRFAGGAAGQSRREARAVLVASLLDDLGFETVRHFDAVRARMDNRSAETMISRLAALGFLTMHTRQLDMVLGTDGAVESYRQSLSEHLTRIAP
eukprot:TRINITY_DN2253_c0_g4_i2.p1 TRINITY_DN2253_c0_g4~~TRINITY_DN2253_c0_g4_i2.p1  ORF type:complete len:1126 (-),score=266.00 TRINITY_DN2253_c0_g4_i2:3669-7046(-)